MTYEIDYSELLDMMRDLDAVAVALPTELLKANQAIVARGIDLAHQNVPVMDGALKNSIQQIDQVTVDGGSFGTSLSYAMQREFGGTIRAVNAPYLWFHLRNGQWVRTKQVTQKGSFYMRRTAEELAPQAWKAWDMAIDRAVSIASQP